MVKQVYRIATMVLVMFGMLVFSGCGGGGSGSSGGAPTAAPASGVAVDPYIVDAVFQEIAADGTTLQESSPSDAQGNFAFAQPLQAGSTLQMKAGAQGKHNNTPFHGLLKKKITNASDVQVVSPLTTLLADEMTETELLALLASVGLQGLENADLHADPMLEVGHADVSERGLRLLQANLAVNGCLQLAGNDSGNLCRQPEQLARTAELVQFVLTRENFAWNVASPQVTSVIGEAGKDFGLFLSASVAVIDQVVAGLKLDPTLDPAADAQILMEMTPSLMLFYHAQANRGDQIVEDAIQAGQILDVEAEEVPVLLAKWKENFPGKGNGVGKNKPPVAIAEENQNVAVGSTVQVTGAKSYDANGDNLTFRWSFHSRPAGSQAVLSNAAAVTPTFVADVAGTFEVSLVVNDGLIDSGASVVTIIAAQGNVPPVAHAGSNQNVVAGDQVTLDGAGSSDADNDPLTYRWDFISRPAGSAAALSSATVVSPTFVADLAGNYVLSLVVNDGQVDSGIAQVTVVAGQGNLIPIANAGSAQSVVAGDQVILDGRGSKDPEGASLTYKWSFASRPAGSAAALSNTAAVQPTFIADLAGTYVVSLIVNDGQVDSKPANVSITATAPVTSEPAPEPTVYEAPVLDSVEINGTSYVLTWSQSGEAPTGGYDIWIDGADTGTTNRTTQLNTVIDGLTAGVQHCFEVEGRFTQTSPAQFPRSNKVCASGSSVSDPTPSGPLRVFPGAEGFGTTTPAGRGGQIIKVTNLYDSGTGSLRAAVQASGPRIVVFEVSGTINLSSHIQITNPYITIAGQTAPSPGINLRGAGITVNTHDVLVQHLRIRVGDSLSGPVPDERDGIQVHGSSYNVVIDHISSCWAVDENGSTWGTVKNVTFSNSIFSEGLYRSIHPKGAHSKGLLIGDHSKNIAVIGNLLAHNHERNPLAKGDVSMVAVNNLVYNGGTSTRLGMVDDYSQMPILVSAVGNAFIDGPNTPTPNQPVRVYSSVVSGSKLYVLDNLSSGTLLRIDISPSPLVNTQPIWDASIKPIAGSTVESWVISHSGARPADRDAVDTRIVSEVKSRSGRLIDSPSQVGGWPVLQQVNRPFVAPANPNGDDDGDGYTNIEEVLHLMAAQVEGR